MDIINITQSVLLLAVITGVTELLNRLRARDYWVVTTITSAAVVGFVFGALGLEGLSPVTGLAAGFAASGALKALSIFGNKSTPSPSNVVER